MNMRKTFLFVLFPLLVAGCTTLPPWKPVPTGQSVVYGQIQDSRRALAFLAFAGIARAGQVCADLMISTLRW